MKRATRKNRFERFICLCVVALGSDCTHVLLLLFLSHSGVWRTAFGLYHSMFQFLSCAALMQHGGAKQHTFAPPQQSIASHNECSSRAGWKTGWKNNSRDGGAMHGKIVMIHCTDYTFRRIHTITTTATTTTTKKISHILISHTFSFSIDDEHCMSV